MIDPSEQFIKMFAEARERQAEESQTALEVSVIKKLFTLSGATAEYKRFSIAAIDGSASRKPDMAFFQERFPKFPVLLYAARIKTAAMLQLPDFFGNGFFKTPILEKYLAIVDSLGGSAVTENVAMAFRIPGAKGANLSVVHNCRFSDDVITDTLEDCPQTRIICYNKAGNVKFTIEAFSAFVKSLSTDWLA